MWVINAVVYNFHCRLMNGAAIMNLELSVMEVPPTVRPESLTSGGVSDDVVGREMGQSNFWAMTERTISLTSVVISVGEWLSLPTNHWDLPQCFIIYYTSDFKSTLVLWVFRVQSRNRAITSLSILNGLTPHSSKQCYVSSPCCCNCL